MGGSSSSFASTCCKAALVLVAACARAAAVVDAGPDTAPSPRAAASTSTSTSDSPAPAVPSSTAPPAPDPMLAGAPTSSKSIGHTSYVLKLALEGGAKAVFKPRSKLPLGDRRYRGEIAAYRLASALGLDNVPRAVPRTFDAATLRALQPDFEARALPDPGGTIRGALMPWIAGYRVLPLEDKAWRTRWEPWVFDAHTSVPDADRTLAGNISTLIVFDYLTANWDRWSGGNVAQNGEGGTVLFVDNDGAFYEHPPSAYLATQLADVKRLVRFSRRFSTALRAMDGASLRAAIGEESPGAPLLPEGVMTAVEARRRAAVDAIDARVRAGGESATYAFE